MEAAYDFGVIGIGVMGSNLLLNMADNGFSVIGYDLLQERCDKLKAAANEGTVVKGTTDIKVFAATLKRPRKILALVPAGPPVDNVIETILPYLQEGDILIDGGNSYFHDTFRRVSLLKQNNIHFFGMGISGGEAGARFGPSLMPGGDKAAYLYLKSIFDAIAAKVNGRPCVDFMGNGAAGHYVKMVHNGIEYALLQMIAEVYDILRKNGFSNDDLQQVFATWNEGPLQSYLIEITAEIFKVKNGVNNKGYLIDFIDDETGSKGTGKWTSQEGLTLGIPIPTIDTAVTMRNLSALKMERTQAAKIYKEVLTKENTNQKLIDHLENTLLFSFIIAYAQGLQLLQRASIQYNFDVNLHNVVNVWKGGCIIRSALLNEFDKAFTDDPALSNVILNELIAEILKEKIASVAAVCSSAFSAGIAIPAISSSFNYFNAFCSDKLSTNLIQAQRDYFGAHTYKRIDKPGVHHTEWNS